MKMRRCEDEKMRYRPPLLEEPCAQTLSGKGRITIPELWHTLRHVPLHMMHARIKNGSMFTCVRLSNSTNLSVLWEWWNLLIGLTAVQELFLDFAIAAAHNPGFAHWTISLPVKTKPFSGQVSLRCHRIIE